MKKRKTFTKLTAYERDLLAVWKTKGFSNKECSRRLKRSPSTIGREIKRNYFRDRDGNRYYVAIHAQAKAEAREYKKAHSKQPLKNPDIYAYAISKLREGWSPDAIAGRLKLKHPYDKHWWITAETIYRWIYQPTQIEKGWYEYLRRKQKKRKKRKGRKVHRSHIPDRVSIRKRPQLINKRKEFGHWEGDTVESKGRKDGIHTEVERVSRKIAGAKISSITSKETASVQKRVFVKIPTKARKSTTLDNGRENHQHYKLKRLKMKTYFADPYSSWQRGSNEHGNWLLRYYFPKGTDFKTVAEEELQEIIEELNNRPRKILSYQTANEVFNKLLKKDSGVAINS